MRIPIYQSHKVIFHLIVLLLLTAGIISDFVYWHDSVRQKTDSKLEYSKTELLYLSNASKAQTNLHLFNTSYVGLAYV